ncbi:MAG: AarF/ABC1/UbiB kinase family protein [Candidatus Tectomicrobia bacterium]|nr:AarF/ABC1/UbiB kinase family protein [Candidatus Tectomicrobia bacterium]
MLIRPRYIARLRRILNVLLKYGFIDVVQHLGLDEFLPVDAFPARTSGDKGEMRARNLRLVLQELGPTYVKLGQVLSTRPDLLPHEYIVELEKLQDEVDPFDAKEAEAIIEEELGVKVSEVFDDFDPHPLASASLGQVHSARLKEGAEVVVKVQRPHIRQNIETDLEVLSEIADFLDKRLPGSSRYDLPGVVAQLEKTLLDELNYRFEARNSEIMRQNLRQFQHIVIPQVFHKYSSKRILTSEMMRGIRVAHLSGANGNYSQLAAELLQAYMKQICIDGFFHCDPHPGNTLIDAENRLVLLDFGMVARLGGRIQTSLTQLLLHLVEGDGENVAEALLDIGERSQEFDEGKFRAAIVDLVGKYHDFPLRDMEFGRVIFSLVKSSFASGLSIPSEVFMLGKALLSLDRICLELDPAFNPVETIDRYVSSVVIDKVRQGLTLPKLYSTVLEMRQLLTELPSRLKSIIRLIGNNEFRLGLHLDRLEELQTALEKIANRITLGVITAALIIGSSNIMSIETSYKLWGYPIFALIGFLGAAGLGFYLIFKIIFTDHY